MHHVRAEIFQNDIRALDQPAKNLFPFRRLQVQSQALLASILGNDFEFALFGRHPELKRAFVALAGTQTLLCRMSGSGSALVAIYRSRGNRDDATMTLGSRHGRTIKIETIATPPAEPVQT